MCSFHLLFPIILHFIISEYIHLGIYIVFSYFQHSTLSGLNLLRDCNLSPALSWHSEWQYSDIEYLVCPNLYQVRTGGRKHLQLYLSLLVSRLPPNLFWAHSQREPILEHKCDQLLKAPKASTWLTGTGQLWPLPALPA